MHRMSELEGANVAAYHAGTSPFSSTSISVSAHACSEYHNATDPSNNDLDARVPSTIPEMLSPQMIYKV